jgi:hypothetical protein
MLENFYRSMWQFTARAPDDSLRHLTNAAQRIIQFRWHHFEFGSRPHLVMSEGLGYWSSYLARLYITRDRYTQACHDFDEITATVNERTKQGGGSINSVYVAAQYGHEDRIRLEIETFYVAAKLLLERIAITFHFFFYGRPIPERGSAHTFLLRHFERLSLDITHRPNAVPRLLELMTHLDVRVVKFRNIHIEHPSQPTVGVRQWTTRRTAADGTEYISMSYVTDDSTVNSIQSVVAGHTENPTGIIALVEEYIGEMLMYFDTYRHASIFAPQAGAAGSDC